MTRQQAAEVILQIFINEQKYFTMHDAKRTAVSMAVAALMNEPETASAKNWEEIL